VRGLFGATLERDRFLVRKRPDEHLRGTHHHLQDRDASLFAIADAFPVKPFEKAH